MWPPGRSPRALSQLHAAPGSWYVCQNKRRISTTNDRSKEAWGTARLSLLSAESCFLLADMSPLFLHCSPRRLCVGYLSPELWLEEQTQRLDRCGPTPIWRGNRDCVPTSVVSVLPKRMLANAFCGNRLNMSLLQGHRKSPVFIVDLLICPYN